MSKVAADLGLEQAIYVLTGTSHEEELDQRVRVVRRGPGALAGFAFVWSLYRAILSRKAVTVAWMYHAMLVAQVLHAFALKRRALVLNFRHSSVKDLRRATKLVWRCVALLTSVMRPVAVFNSQAAVLGHGPAMALRESVVLPNVVQDVLRDVDRIYPRTFGFIGRNHRDKGADFLPELIEALLLGAADWRFVVAGPGTEKLREEVAARLIRAKMSPDRVCFLGSLSDPSEFYRIVSILIVPSRTESFPNVVVEAVGHGVLVSAMNVGDIRRILNGAYPVAGSLGELLSQSLFLSVLDPQRMRELAESAHRSVLGPLDRAAIIGRHVDLWSRA